VVFQDPTCAVHGSDVWIVYGTGQAAPSSATDAPASAVEVVHSASGGATFDAPVTVSDGATGTQYLFPRLARDPSGKLEVVYYQGTTSAPVTLTRATSDAGGAWSTSSLGGAGTFTLDRTIASWLGDMLGLASAGGSAFISYTDNSAGKADVRFVKVAAP
jgi:hypothetical protein